MGDEFGRVDVLLRGILSLERSLPLLVATSCAVSDSVAAIAREDGRLLVSGGVPSGWGRLKHAMLRFLNEVLGNDNCRPDYLQCQLVRVALEIIEPHPDIERSVRRISTGLAEAWGNCDYIIERTEAGQEPVFGPLKTTLVCVEWAWQEKDRGQLYGAPEVYEVFESRRSALREPARWRWREQACTRIVELAGW